MMIVVWWNAAGGRTMQFVCEVIRNKKPMISITASSKKLLFFVCIICARELSHLALQSFMRTKPNIRSFASSIVSLLPISLSGPPTKKAISNSKSISLHRP